jgi:hypothetical protein
MPRIANPGSRRLDRIHLTEIDALARRWPEVSDVRERAQRDLIEHTLGGHLKALSVLISQLL